MNLVHGPPKANSFSAIFPQDHFRPRLLYLSSSKAGMVRPQNLLSAAPFLSCFFPAPVWALYRPPFIQAIAICSRKGSFFVGLPALPQQPKFSFSYFFFLFLFTFFLSFAPSSVFSHFLNTLFVRGLTSLTQRTSCILHCAAENHRQLAEKKSCITVKL